MGRERRLLCKVLRTAACLLFSACTGERPEADISIVIGEADVLTKSELPDEEKISNVSFLIFDNYGRLEHSIYIDGAKTCQAKLLKGETYRIRAFVNFGYRVKAQHIEDLTDLQFHLAYPDEYKDGIPMVADTETVILSDSQIVLEPVRLMSRISIRMDRSRLSDNVSMEVSSVRIGNCPKRVAVFGKSRAESEDDCFTVGYSHSGPECSVLNTENSMRISDGLSLYMLENMQGRFCEDGISEDEDKVFGDYDIRKDICSYLEIGLEYSSPTWTSMSSPLLYRFYLGEDRNSLDVERNCHYHITICPEDDGLKGDGWRIDKTGLQYTGKTGLVKYPSGYIRGDIGDKIHLGCIVTPSHAPFDIGLEYLEDDKAEGIYDYEIDADGHGVTLHLTGPGTGLIYMEAGDPINEAALFIVEVNLP